MFSLQIQQCYLLKSERVKKWKCEHSWAHTDTVQSPHAHSPSSSPSRLHHRLILYSGDEVAYLSAAAPSTPHSPPPPPANLSGPWKVMQRASAKAPNLTHFIPSWGNLPGSEKSKLICVWNANANSPSPTLYTRAQGPSPRCKTHLLSVLTCVKWGGLPRSQMYLTVDCFGMKGAWCFRTQTLRTFTAE